MYVYVYIYNVMCLYVCFIQGPLETIHHNVTGFLCPPSPSDFAKAMMKIGEYIYIYIYVYCIYIYNVYVYIIYI